MNEGVAGVCRSLGLGHIDDGEQGTHGTLMSVCLFILIVTSSLTQRASVAGKDSTPQMLLELLYFLCIALLAPFMVYRWARSSTGGAWMFIALAALVTMALSPLLDAPLCWALGASAAPHAAVAAWAAVDVMVAALWMQHRAWRAAAAVAEASQRAGVADKAKEIEDNKEEASKKTD